MMKNLKLPLVVGAALLAIAPASAIAQSNTTGDTSADTSVTNSTLNGTEVVDPLATNVGTTTADPLATNSGGSLDTSGTGAGAAGTTVAPVDPLATDPLANDMALAQNVQPQEEDNDFPWGLLGLLGLAGLLGRKKNDHHDHDTRRATGTSTISDRP